MIVRKLRFSDFDDVGKIYDTGYTEIHNNKNYGDILAMKKPSLNDRVEKFSRRYKDMLNGDALHYVAEDNGKVIGYCLVTKKDIPDSEMSHVGVLGVRVADGYRRKSVGTALLRYTIDKCKNKFEIIEAYTFSSNKEAKALLRKFRFKRWGTAPRYIKRGKRYIDMEYMYLIL